jgi:serine protease Do
MQDMRLIRSVGLAAILAVAMPMAAHAQKPQAKGWVGVLITTGIGESNGSGRLIFNDYPVIESIDPGSPAEKAGLLAGDILISINSQDFKKNPIPMRSLLVPGRKVVFRYQRDNVAKKVEMTVAQRPAGTSEKLVVSYIEPLPSPDRRAATERGVLRKASADLPMPNQVIVAPIPFGTGTPSIAVAGAELTQLNEGLRELAKIKGDGIFIVNVTEPSPAAEAGLRSGDVIVRIENQLAQNPGQLIRFIEAAQMARTRQVLLQILRKQKEQNVTLRW